MIKTKLFTFLFLLFLSHFSFGQDGIFWEFEVKFKIDTTNIKDNLQSKLLDFEVLYEDSYYPLARDNSSKLKYDAVTNQYMVTLSYSSIGGASQVRYVWCPEIYLKINLEHDLRNNEKRKFFKLIPIYFENAEGNFQKYDLGTISFSEFLNGYRAGGKLKIMSPYEIIEVKADKKINKKGNDEYQLRRMNKLVKLELKNED